MSQEALKGADESQSWLHHPGHRRLSVHDTRGPADFHEPEFRSEEEMGNGEVETLESKVGVCHLN